MEEPTKQHLVHEEAQKFLEVPPVPVAAPTDPFWAHFESDIDETSLEQSDIFYSKISTVIIGSCIRRDINLIFQSFNGL